MNSSHEGGVDQAVPQLLTLEQTAERLSVCRRTVNRLVAAGRLRVLKIGVGRGSRGGATRIELSELVRYVEELRGGKRV